MRFDIGDVGLLHRGRNKVADLTEHGVWSVSTGVLESKQVSADRIRPVKVLTVAITGVDNGGLGF